MRRTIRTIRTIVTGLVVIAAVATAATPAAQASSDPVSRIYSASQNACLDVSTTDPAHYFLDTYGAHCNGSSAQLYSFHLLAVTPPNTYQIKSQSTGQCLTKYRSAIRQAPCGSASTWTMQRVGTTGHQYQLVLPSTVGSANPGCVQVNPNPGGYPGALFNITYCSSAPSQVLTLDVTL